MKNLSKKALLSILSLVLTFVALGATTFAWFSLGTTATVDQFDVNVRGSEGLEISLGDTDAWYTTLSSDVIKAYLYSQFDTNADIDDTSGNLIMDGVTSKDGESFFLGYEYDTATTPGTIYMTHNKPAVANKDFLTFDIKLRTKLASKIDLNHLLVTGSGGTWTSDQDFTLANGSSVTVNQELTTDLVDALRIAFVVTDGDTTVYEKEENGINTLGSNLDNTKGALQYFAKKTGRDNILKPQTGWTPVVPGKTFVADGTTQLRVADFATAPTEGSYNEVTITINVWFEGYDGEAFDAVLEQFVSIAMAFSLA